MSSRMRNWLRFKREETFMLLIYLNQTRDRLSPINKKHWTNSSLLVLLRYCKASSVFGACNFPSSRSTNRSCWVEKKAYFLQSFSCSLSTTFPLPYYCMHNNKPSFPNLLLNLQNVYSNDLATQKL
jgi:hypothetical protein